MGVSNWQYSGEIVRESAQILTMTPALPSAGATSTSNAIGLGNRTQIEFSIRSDRLGNVFVEEAPAAAGPFTRSVRMMQILAADLSLRKAFLILPEDLYIRLVFVNTDGAANTILEARAMIVAGGV